MSDAEPLNGNWRSERSQNWRALNETLTNPIRIVAHAKYEEDGRIYPVLVFSGQFDEIAPRLLVGLTFLNLAMSPKDAGGMMVVTGTALADEEIVEFWFQLHDAVSRAVAGSLFRSAGLVLKSASSERLHPVHSVYCSQGVQLLATEPMSSSEELLKAEFNGSASPHIDPGW